LTFCCVSMAIVVTRTHHNITYVPVWCLSRDYDILKSMNRMWQFKMCPCIFDATVIPHNLCFISTGYVTMTSIVKYKSHTEQISSFCGSVCTFVPSLLQN
jgi:hypothetical protein